MVLIKKVALKLQTPSPKVALQRLGQQQKAGAHHDSPSRGAATCTALSRQSPSIQEEISLCRKSFYALGDGWSLQSSDLLLDSYKWTTIYDLFP